MSNLAFEFGIDVWNIVEMIIEKVAKMWILDSDYVPFETKAGRFVPTGDV